MTESILRTEAEEAILARFPAEKAGLPGSGAVARLRELAFETVAAAGLPHRRVEEWKYTDLKNRLKTFPAAAGPADAARLAALRPVVEGDGARRLVVANGRFRPDLSDLAGLEAGLSVASLADALSRGDATVELALELDAATSVNTAVALNTAFMTDGLLIAVADGAVIDRPVEIVHVNDSAEPASTAVRHLVRVGAKAGLTLIETVETLHAVASQSNIVTVVDVGDDAAFDHIRLQVEPDVAVSMGTLIARIGARARVETFNAALGAALARNQVYARFVGRDATGGFRGLTMLSGRRHADTTLAVVHDAENCKSRELYKAVIDGPSRSVFAGRISVPSHAQKTDARMRTAALLLSEEGEADAKPELEIFADDVQCGHGATCGAIDDELLFYLQSRGIPREEAEAMLILAFLGEAIDEIKSEPVRVALVRRVEDWLGARAL
jgi:Fe-S cluster assembly protein SufD